jgi:hypothetical protein
MDWLLRTVLVPAVVSALVVLLYRWIDRPSVRWRTYNRGASWNTDLSTYYDTMPDGDRGDSPSAKSLLANAGDADAFDVEITGHGCGVQIDPFDSEYGPGRKGSEQLDRDRPIVRAGSVERIHVSCHPDYWSRAGIVVSYDARSWWRGVHRTHHVLALNEIGPCPGIAGRRGLNAPEGVDGASAVASYPVRQEPGIQFPPAPEPLTSRWQRRRFAKRQLRGRR